MNYKTKILKKNSVKINDINLFIYDFDGLFTDNYFFLNSKGEEFTRIFRSDELAIKKIKNLGKDQIILSSSNNITIKYFAKKWNISCYINIKDKSEIIKKFISKNKNIKICYFGNDDNDISAAKLCNLVICPRDAFPKMMKISDFYTKSLGGQGVLREFIEKMIL